MDIENLESWISQPDVCRCCLSTCGTWDLTASYINNVGIKEVFSDMLHECYGISLSYLTEWGPGRMVCELCVNHLRDACSFREQVLKAQVHYVQYYNRRESVNSLSIKLEKENEIGIPDHIADDFPPDSDDDDKTHTDTHIPEIVMHTSVKQQKRNKRKKHKMYSKSKQKKKKNNSYEDDSDTPIAELKKNVPSPVNVKDDIVLAENIHELSCKQKENEPNCFDNKNDISIQESQNHLHKKESTATKSVNNLENRYLRSNITLVLKCSTILPFKHINNSKYTCLYCDNSYLFFDQLKRHINESHSNISERDIVRSLKCPKDLIKADISLINCKLCDENFKNMEKLIEHLIEIHKKIYYNIARFKPSHGILGFNLSSERLLCHICEKEFRFFKSLSVHMNEHSDSFVCHVCGKKFVSDHRLQTHVLSHRTKDIKCKHCDKEFRSVSAKTHHLRKIHNGAKFQCPECKQIFTQYQHRLRHLVEVHKVKKPEFKCDICFKEFAGIGGLRAHIRYSHLKTTEYPCQLCGKVFIYKWILQRHLEIHAGVKNYECKFCDKKFNKSYTLQIHVRKHLNDKRFVCTLCKAAFIQKCSLKKHIQGHHPDAGIDVSKL